MESQAPAGELIAQGAEGVCFGEALSATSSLEYLADALPDQVPRDRNAYQITCAHTADTANNA
jgi:hypothetical protein